MGRLPSRWAPNIEDPNNCPEMKRLRKQCSTGLANGAEALLWRVVAFCGKHQVHSVDGNDMRHLAPPVCDATLATYVHALVQCGALQKGLTAFAAPVAERIATTFRTKVAQTFETAKTASKHPPESPEAKKSVEEPVPNKDPENVSFQFSSANAVSRDPVTDDDAPWAKYGVPDEIDTEEEYRQLQETETSPDSPPLKAAHTATAKTPWEGPRGNLSADFVALHAHRLPDLVFGDWAINSANKHGIRDQHFVAAIDVLAEGKKQFGSPKDLGAVFWGILRHKRDGVMFDPRKHKRKTG